MGSIRTLREKSRQCALCHGAVQSFGPIVAEDSHCQLYAAAFCICPLGFSDKPDEVSICQHPKHVVFELDSQPRQNKGFQICFNPRATLLQETSDTNAAGLFEETDKTCFTGRRVGEKIDLRLVRRWLDLCEYHHAKECHNPIWPGSPPQPKNFLVIDVELRCIVSAPPDCRYTALSYVWGSAQRKKLTRKNWDVFSQAKALDRSDLPATICDAMMLTRALGEKYCWVDALCIFQDDPSSQQDQISQMGAIYSRALITIVNAAGDGSTGLPGIHAGTRTLPQIKIQLQNFDLIEIADDEYHLDGTSTLDNISMWEKRAWTYQEQLFSKRMLIFRKKQVYWHCRSATWAEEKVLEVKGIPPILASVEKMISGVSYLPRNLTEENIQSLETIGDKEYLLYTQHVRAYSSRQLSYASDALNAFAGVIRALSLLSKDEFIWGLPKSNFADALLWSVRDSQKNTCLQNVFSRDGLVHQLPFPSWSWASRFCGSSTERYPINTISCHPKGRSLEPGLIAFFSCLLSGGMVRITPRPDYRNEPPQNNRPRDSMTAMWLGHPRVISNVSTPTADDEIIHSGTLKFWTSVATIYFFRDLQPLRGAPLVTFLSANGDILMATGYDLPQVCVSPDDPRIPKEVRLAELKNIQGYKLQGDCEVVILDLVIVHGEIFEVTGGISGLSRSGRVLHALSVSWNDRGAIREGSLSIAEEHWILLKNREWKLVTLQ
ncbi:Heterokaryon incompatibility protein [Rutstroemia sp. NJR-2017a BBW]|nr:Heterokaryon incompatibility protein [Rutstroemia sp. NJR-2017a BBW]